jgi:predicted ribosome quality control (RQC) complex YloA/Tae2 family protein
MKNIIIYISENDKEYNLLIGENQKENDTIIKSSQQNDIWFHLEKISGPHFILQNNGEIIPKRYINYIGTLFREYKSNLSNRYSVIYTEVKNVKLTDTLGTVNVSKTKKISF